MVPLHQAVRELQITLKYSPNVSKIEAVDGTIIIHTTGTAAPTTWFGYPVEIYREFLAMDHLLTLEG